MSPSPSKTSTSPDPQSAAKREALTVWKSMRKEETKAAAIGYADKTNLSHYSYDKALAQTKRALFDYRQQGVGFKGAPTSTVKATSVDSAGKTVDVRECMDTTHWKPILKDSGKDISASGQPQRYVITGVVKDLGERWMVQNYTLHKDKSC
ncbi:hypothetical protein [Streptomyces sp. BH034]|uniref:hypothetical protein n=2 Tax=unclassified Streptomyces TaxID=2593676 RepID=UPI003BB564CA